MGARTVQQWVDALQEAGRYAFLRSEAVQEAGGSPGSVKKSLQRLIQHRRIAKIKDYFLVIVPLEYRAAGSPPASWLIRDLMAAMKLPYYVGLLSAAGLHGASHQQPQELQVVTARPVRPLRAGRVRLRFFVKRSIDRVPVVDMKTPTGTMRVSTPEATAVDLGQARCTACCRRSRTCLVHSRRTVYGQRRRRRLEPACACLADSSLGIPFRPWGNLRQELTDCLHGCQQPPLGHGGEALAGLNARQDLRHGLEACEHRQRR